MDAFYKNLGFKKMDELDQSIELKSVQWTWRINIILMLIAEFVVLILMWNDIIPIDFGMFPMFIIFLQNFLMAGFRCFFQLKLVEKGTHEYRSNIVGLLGNSIFFIGILSTMIFTVIRYL